jgi:catechol 2,3-dioxygenase-like lactoylglutathione lyase family enzyme
MPASTTHPQINVPTSVLTQLRTTGIEAEIDFYLNKLGLELDFRYEDFYAGIKTGEQIFHLKLVDDPDPSIPFVAAGEHMHLFFILEDADRMAADLEAKGVAIFIPPRNTPWGMREFYSRDVDGHVLAFAQELEG